MPITVGSLQSVENAGGDELDTFDFTVSVGTAGVRCVLFLHAHGRPGTMLSAVLDPAGANLSANIHASAISARSTVIASIVVPSTMSGSYTLRTDWEGISVTSDCRVYARVLYGTGLSPVSAYAEFDPGFPFTPVLPLGTLTAGDLVLAGANVAATTVAGFGDWSASTQTLTSEGGAITSSGNFYYIGGILNGVTGGAPFTVTPTGTQVGCAGAAAYTAFSPLTVEAEASITEDDDSTLVASEVVVTYLDTTQGNTWPATTISASVDTGAADASKQIVGVLFMMDAGCHPTSATFAGISASIDIEQFATGSGYLTSILRAAVGTASGTQSMSITVTPYTGFHIVDWYSVTGANPVLVDSGGDNNTAATPLSVALDGHADGVVLAGFNGNALNFSFVDFDFERNDSEDSMRTTSGYDATASGSNTVTVGTDTGNALTLAAISFEPFLVGATAEVVVPMLAEANLTEDDDTLISVLPVVVSYLDTTAGLSAASTGLISVSVNIGAAEATRQIIAVVMERSGSGTNAGTFAGVASTLDVHLANDGGERAVDIRRALVPLGSGSQAMTINTVVPNQAYIIDWYSVTGADTTIVDTGSDGVLPDLSFSIDAVDGGYLLMGRNSYTPADYSFDFEFEHVDSDSDNGLYSVSGWDAVSAGTISLNDACGFNGSSAAAISFEPLLVSATAEIEFILAGQEVAVSVGEVTVEIIGGPTFVDTTGNYTLTVSAGFVGVFTEGGPAPPATGRAQWGGQMVPMGRWMGH